MKLGIDISQTAFRGTGVARFTEGLAQGICDFDHDNEWHFFFSSLRGKPPAALIETIHNAGHHFDRAYWPPTILSHIWNDLHIYDVQHITGPLDWFITSDWTEPPASCRKATIVHDLAYVRYPETVATSIRRTQKHRMKHVVTESRIIFADSESTKDDLLTLLHVDRSRVTVNYPGISPPRAIQGDSQVVSRVKNPYILCVGKREPRKNLDRLIEAYTRAQLHDTDLIIVGEKGWGTTPKPSHVSDRVHFLGYVNDDELSALYRDCLFFVYPSIWDGFGYLVIEAMSYKAPVATSETSSLGEIAKGNALLFDPNSIESITDALVTLSQDAKIRWHLAKKGAAHAAQFTWERYYKTLMKHLV
ncbi:glycosyltransferase family 4 protein [Candidatus Microgenomates bacterium]|nr:glycosyltransferase family 4 protein [Candidatus Microgenomates bacterium]